MPTIEQILFTNFERLDHAADAWDDVARRLKALRDSYDVQVVRPVAPPVLYAADTAQVREYNEQYGDDPTMRENVIRTRMESWQGFEQHLADTRSWEALTPEQRAAAIAAVGGTLPYGAEPTIPTVYPLADGVQTSVPGSNSSLPWFPPPPGSVPVDPPGTPSPAPAPPPKAP